MRVEQFELLGDLIEVVAQGEHDGQIPRIEVALSEKFVVSLCSINLIIVLVMEPLIYIISIIWWILCIVLFFKVWGMCNDVRKIKNQIDRNDDYSTKIDFLLRIGEKEKAKEKHADWLL